MATPTPGTFPSFPPYQPGALQYTGSEIFLLVTSATATAAATYYDLVTNMVGKVPGVLPNAVPAASDMVTFLQASSGLPMATLVGNLGVAAGNLPAGGGTGQILAKTSGSNYISSWQSITNFVGVGNGLFTTGNATTITIALNTAIATFAGLANPTGTVGLVAVNGAATTGMRSDAAPPLSQAITPTWTGQHIFNSTTQFNGPVGIGIAPESVTNLAVKQLSEDFAIAYFSSVNATSVAYLDLRNTTGIGYLGVEGADAFLMNNGQPYAVGLNDEAGNGIEFGTGNTLRVFITGTGNVGIGTSSPPASTVLYVSGTASLTALGVGTTVVGSALVSVAGTAVVSVLGIGTATPSATLDVNGFIKSDVGFARVTTAFNVVSTTTLAEVPALSVAVASNGNYFFEAILYCTAGATGGTQLAFQTNTTPASVIYDAQSYSGGSLVAQGRATTIGVAVATSTSATTPTIRVVGTLSSGTATVFYPQIAQAAATTATTVVLPGSTMKVFQIN
jgi:hypothetical protein